MKPKPIYEQVLVITGATSGIGLATARLAVRRGARVVLVARDAQALERVASELNRRDAGSRRATSVVADVADAGQIERVVAEAEAAFGGFDTWVNNAGVSIYGRVIDVPLEDQRRLFDVNVWGLVSGSRAAVRYLSTRRGVLINIGSITSDRALPLQGTYSASKHAVKAFTDAIRMETEQAGLPIAVCLVKPSAIDTPFFDHARNYMAYEVEAPPPLYSPDVVARAILECAERPRRDVTVGGAGRAMTLGAALAPRLTDAYMKRLMFWAQQGAPVEDLQLGNLESPTGPHLAAGRQSRSPRGRSAYTRATLSDLNRALPLVAAAVAVSAGVGLWRQRRAPADESRPPAHDFA